MYGCNPPSGGFRGDGSLRRAAPRDDAAEIARSKRRHCEPQAKQSIRPVTSLVAMTTLHPGPPLTQIHRVAFEVGKRAIGQRALMRRLQLDARLQPGVARLLPPRRAQVPVVARL